MSRQLCYQQRALNIFGTRSRSFRFSDLDLAAIYFSILLFNFITQSFTLLTPSFRFNHLDLDSQI